MESKQKIKLFRDLLESEEKIAETNYKRYKVGPVRSRERGRYIAYGRVLYLMDEFEIGKD